MKTTTNTATQGIMTNEVGAITGEVEIETSETAGGVTVHVAYGGAEDSYTVEGSPAPAGTSHEDIVSQLTQESELATKLG